MEQENEFEIDTISLIDEDGVEHEFEIVDAMEIGGQEYMALVPLYDEPEEVLEDSGELVILRVSKDVDDAGEPFLEAILDEDEYDKVAEQFMERLKDEFEFEEEEGSPGGIKH